MPVPCPFAPGPYVRPGTLQPIRIRVGGELPRPKGPEVIPEPDVHLPAGADGEPALGSIGARDLAITAAATSALVHAVLAPEHFADHPVVAVLFALATLGLVGISLALTRPWLGWAPGAGALLFAALIASYPLVHAITNEGTDALGIGTKVVEAAGLVACLRSFRSSETSLAPIGVITGVFVGMILLSFGHHH